MCSPPPETALKLQLAVNNHQQKDTGTHQNKIPHIPGPRRSCNETVGGAQSCQNQIPYPLSGQPIKWRTTIPKKFLHYCKSSRPPSDFPIWQSRKRLGIPRKSDFEGQWDLIAELPQDWGKQRLLKDTNKTLCIPGERSSDPTRD